MRPGAAAALARLRAVLGSLALSCGAIAAVAGAFEVVLRLIASGGDAGAHRFDIYRPSPTLTHELRPNWSGRFAWNDFDVHVNVNALGFRGPPVSPARAAGVRRILVVGDSFAFGWGVEDREAFPAVLEAELRGAGVRTEVIDAAVPGYSTDHHLIFLRERGFALAPDLILISICGNDTEELAWSTLRLGPDGLPIASLSKRRFINARGEMRFLNSGLFDLPPLPLPEAAGDWLYQHSHAFRWLRIRFARAWLTWVGRLAAAREAIPPGEVPTGPIASLAPAEIARALAGSPEFRLRYHRELLRAIEREAAARGIAVRYVLTEGAGEALRSDCAASRCLDQATLFTRASHPEDFLPVDGHWSAAGQERVGKTLARWLRDDGELGLGSQPMR